MLIRAQFDFDLTRRPLDELMFDKSFVSICHNNCVIAQNIFTMGISFGLTVVAESVET